MNKNASTDYSMSADYRNQDSGRQTGSRNTLGTIGDSDAISMGRPTFLAISASLMGIPTLSDVGRLPKFKMTAAKPEVEITWNG